MLCRLHSWAKLQDNYTPITFKHYTGNTLTYKSPQPHTQKTYTVLSVCYIFARITVSTPHDLIVAILVSCGSVQRVRIRTVCSRVLTSKLYRKYLISIYCLFGQIKLKKRKTFCLKTVKTSRPVFTIEMIFLVSG